MTQYVRHIPSGDIYVFSEALMKRGDCELVAGDPFAPAEVQQPPPEPPPPEPVVEPEPQPGEIDLLELALSDYKSGQTIKPRRGRPPKE